MAAALWRRGLSSFSSRAAARVRTLDAEGSVFAEFSPLAIKHNAINLGQGFPNVDIPQFLRNSAANAVGGSTLVHQYTRSQGHLPLVNQLAQFYEADYGRKIDPITEIVTTVGASESIYSAMQAFINPGDEVILMEPFYDSYPASVTLAGGIPVSVPLRPHYSNTDSRSSADWKLDIEELRRAITPRTRMIVINTPHNPIGKVFSKAELEPIADLAKQHNLLVLSDEVYETLVYDDSTAGPHVKIGSLPGMFDRTLTVGSVGKAFSVTGWKIGWTVGAPDLVRALWMVHQMVSFAVVTPLQEATATAFAQAPKEDYFNKMRESFKAKRDRLFKSLSEVGLNPTLPDGSYFILADTSRIQVPESFRNDSRRDYNVCRWLTAEVGVAAIPPSAFYSAPHKHLSANLARFCFCKTDDMLIEAANRLQKRLL